jgi:hypothetical protein
MKSVSLIRLRDGLRVIVMAVCVSIALGCLYAAHAATWNPEVRLTHIPGQSWGPRITAYNGILHVVWFEYPNFIDPEIFYSRSIDNGSSWSTPQNISNNPSRQDLFPSVAADANGTYIFWSSDTANGEVFFRRSVDGGLTWATEQRLSNASGYSRASDILIDRAGYIHIVWYDDRNGYPGIYHRQSCDHGATWSPEQWVTQFDGAVDSVDPKIAQAEDGTLTMLYWSTRAGEPQGGWPPFEMYVLRGRSNGCSGGTTWMYPAQKVSYGLPDEYSNNYSGSITAGKSGRVHIAYWDEKAGNNVVYRRGVPAASGWGKPQVLSTFSVNHPETEGNNRPNPGLVEDINAGVHLFFSEHGAYRDSLSVGRMFYRWSGDGGLTWDPPVQLGTSTLTASPQAVYQNGRVHVVWIDFRDNNSGSEIYYRNLDLNLPDLVDHYFTSILKRAPDPGGKAYWEGEVARAQALGVDVKEAYMVMAGNFFNSTEYLGFGRTDPQYVTDLYLTFFNRSPDSQGLNYWLNKLSSGSSRNMVMYFFMFSTEFSNFMSNLYGSTMSRAEVYAVVDFYRGILDRLPDDNGFSYWLGRFRTAQCTGAAAVTAEVESISASFFSSQEYAARGRNNAQFVQDLYYTFMRRFAGVSEVSYWIGELDGQARTRDGERQAFIQSPEFQGRVTAMINEGCL